MPVEAEEFEEFLKQYKDSGFVIDYIDLINYNPEWKEILDMPDAYLNEMKKATKSLGEETDVLVKNVPHIVPLRTLGSKFLGKLIMVEGIVNKVLPTRPMISTAAYECRKCGEIKKIAQLEPFLVPPIRCGIGRKGCSGKQFRLIEDPNETTYFDVQELAIQEKPEDLPSGQAPQTVSLEITKDSMINFARAGDIINVTGIPRTKPPSSSTKKRKWLLFIDVIHIEKTNKDPSDIEISDEESQEIRWLASDPQIYDKLAGSIIPSIYGCEEIKESIMYQLFGGREKKFADKTIRGNIHILWIDDPSKAKSQILMAAKNLASRGLYVAGGGASGAGLTAAVIKIDGELYALEAGAVVLANNGICCIDEIEKMNNEDRARIHEAMEQQTVNIQKASVHYTLPAKTSILAAGNPTFGRYDFSRTIAENVSLPPTILARFDLIFIGKGDKPDSKLDDAIATHILEGSTEYSAPISKETFRKYIAFAKRLNPIMTKEGSNRIKEFYKKMRNVNASEEESPIAITARQLEGLIRISEAHARIRLSNKVEEQDALAAINIMMQSLQQVGIDPETGRMDIDAIMGTPKTMRDKMSGIVEIFKDGKSHNKEEIIELMEERGVSRNDTMKLLTRMISESRLYEPHGEGYYMLLR